MDLFEYNMYSSILEFLTINKTDGDVIIDKPISVYPSYPKVTKFVNPSIILQKIVGKAESIGMGNDLGSVLIDDTYHDAKGILHSTIYQIDIIMQGVIDQLKISSYITDLFNRTRSGYDKYHIDPIYIPLLDFTDNKTEIGSIQLIGDIDSNNLQIDPNDDYRTVLRLELEAMQTLIPNYDIVDFSKPINWIQTINI